MKIAAVGLSAGLIALMAAGANAADLEGVTFEALAADAGVTEELGLLVAPFIDDCRQLKRDIDRARCQGVRTALQSQLAGQKMLFARQGADAVVVSGYDGRTKGVRVAVLGCLACKEPVDVDGQQRFVTLTPPGASPGAAPLSSELFRTTIAFSSAAAADKWLKTVKPNLRVELVFRAVGEPWKAGENRGVAFKPLGVRISDRCTGEIVASQPPSRGATARTEACVDGKAQEETAEEDERPSTLGTAAINQAMAGSRKDLDACLAKFKVAGTAALDFVVASTGVPQSVTVGGSAAGTALAECLVEVGSRVRFPAFRGEPQRFKYPLLLRK